MKPNKGKYIKHVELIPEDEFRNLGVFQSMIRQFREHSDLNGHDINMQMVLSGDDGELKTMGIDDIVCRKEDFMDAFSDGRTLVAVKLLWSDGTWEHGFKMWRQEDRVYRRNSKLMPLYAKVGVVNEETGEIEDVFDLERESRVPRILQLIPMWNEKVRDAISKGDRDAVKGTGASYEEWIHVSNVMHSPCVSANAHWDTVKIGRTNKKMAIDLAFDRNNWWTPVMTTWKERVCKQEFGAIAEMMEKEAVKVFCYSYIKSLYCNHMKSVKEYKVIPLSDVLMLQKRKWDGKSGKYVEEEVWNSLDATCKGDV